MTKAEKFMSELRQASVNEVTLVTLYACMLYVNDLTDKSEFVRKYGVMSERELTDLFTEV